MLQSNSTFLNRINGNTVVNPHGIEMPKMGAAGQLKRPGITLKPPTLNMGATKLKPAIKPAATVEEAVEAPAVGRGSEDKADPIVGFDKSVKGDDVVQEVPAEVIEATPAETEDVSVEEIAQEAIAAPAEETQKKRKTRRGSKKAAKTVETESGPAEVRDMNATEEQKEQFIYSFPTTEMSYIEAARAIKSTMEDKEWEDEKTEIIKKLSEVVISNDMTPGPIQIAIASLSHLRDEIWLPYCSAKTAYIQFVRKEPEGKLTRFRLLNSNGTNENERRKNGILACMNFEAEGKNINLYEMVDEMEDRYNFYKEAMAHLQSKIDCLKTLTYNLNSEAKLTPHMEG